jgi:glutathione peroxidase
VLLFSPLPGFSQDKTPPATPAAGSATPATPTPRNSPSDPPKETLKQQSGGQGGPGGGGPGGGRRRGGGGGSAEGGDAKPEKTAYDYYLPGPDGKEIPLANYKDKIILVVNLGRKSTYADQLPALVKLNDTYKDKGLVVIGVPCNDFGAAEPGTNAEIQKAYADAKVDFLIAGVSKLTGDDELPFYLYLTKGKGAPAGGPVVWNDTKFVIDKKGAVIARFAPDVAPDSLEARAVLDQIMDGTYKPKKEGGGKPGADEGEGGGPN